MSGSVKLLTADIWPRITALTRKRGRKLAAVPFVGQGAVKRLPLGEGDTLIARVNMATVKAGMTDPSEILKYIRRGVSVHNVDNLHAKVFVLGATTIIGSANVSQSSEHGLIEAGIESRDKSLVAASRKFVISLRGDIIEPQHARNLKALYVPPKGPRRPGAGVKTSPLVAVALEERVFTKIEKTHVERAMKTFKKMLKKPEVFVVRHFTADGKGWVDRFKGGDRVLMCTDTARGTLISPPGRVITTRKFKENGCLCVVVGLAIRKRLRRISKKRLLKFLGADGKVLKALDGIKPIQNRAAHRIAQLWPTAGERSVR